jgi:ribosomal protein S18 acetylase RimI-like enzyme
MDTTTFKLADFDNETKDEFVLVAHQGQHVAGFVSAWMPDHFIHHLYVDTPYQQHGIGTALLNALFLKANASFRLKCLQKNKAAIAFYKKKRFIEKERVTDIAGEYILFESTHS